MLPPKAGNGGEHRKKKRSRQSSQSAPSASSQPHRAERTNAVRDRLEFEDVYLGCRAPNDLVDLQRTRAVKATRRLPERGDLQIALDVFRGGFEPSLEPLTAIGVDLALAKADEP